MSADLKTSDRVFAGGQYTAFYSSIIIFDIELLPLSPSSKKCLHITYKDTYVEIVLPIMFLNTFKQFFELKFILQTLQITYLQRILLIWMDLPDEFVRIWRESPL